MKENYTGSFDNLISKLLSIYTSNETEDILMKLKEVLNTEKEFAEVFLTLSKKYLNTKIQFEFLIIFGGILEIEEFLELAEQIYNKNSAVVNESFQRIFESFHGDFILIKNPDIILLFGEILEKIYANGFSFVGSYITQIYNNFEAGYSKPLVFRILKNCGKVYSWSDFEAVELYKALNFFISESEYKGTNFEKSISLLYKGIFLENYYKKNLKVLDISYNETDITQIFKRSYELGNLLAKFYIKEDDKFNCCPYYYDDSYYDYDDDDDDDLAISNFIDDDL